MLKNILWSLLILSLVACVRTPTGEAVATVAPQATSTEPTLIPLPTDPPVELAVTATPSVATPAVEPSPTQPPDPVSHPPLITELEPLSRLGAPYRQMVAYQEVAYVLVADEVHMIHISEGRNELVGRLLMPQQTRIGEILVADGYLFVATFPTMGVDIAFFEVLIYDLANPEQPAFVGSFEAAGLRDLAVVNERAFVLAGNGIHVPFGVSVFDVSDPAGSTQSTFYEISEPVTVVTSRMLAEPGRVYIQDGDDLLILGSTDPTNLQFLARLTSQPLPDHILNQTGYRALDDHWEIIDFSDPANPSVQTRLDPIAQIVAVSETDIYYTEHPDIFGLKKGVWQPDGTIALDQTFSSIGEPLSLSFVEGAVFVLYDKTIVRFEGELGMMHHNDEFEAQQLVRLDDIVYVFGGTGLHLVDVSQPTQPRHWFDHPRWSQVVAVTSLGQTLFIVEQRGAHYELSVVDASEPLQLLVSGYLEPALSSNPVDIAITPAMLFVADTSQVLLIDVSGGSDPIVQGSIHTAVSGFTVAGDMVFVANEFGLEVWDVSELSRPELLSTTSLITPTDETFNPNAPVPATDVVVVGDYAYVSSDQFYFGVIDLTDLTAPTLVSMVYTGCAINDLMVEGRWIYAPAGCISLDVSPEIHFFDTTTPHESIMLTFPAEHRCLCPLLFHDNLLYQATGEGGLVVLEVNTE